MNTDSFPILAVAASLTGSSNAVAEILDNFMFGPGKLDGLTTLLVHETPTYESNTDLFELAFPLVETEDILGIHWGVQLHPTEGLLRRVPSPRRSS